MNFVVQDTTSFNVAEAHRSRIEYKWSPFNKNWNDRDGPAREMAQFLIHARGLKCLIDVGANIGIFSLTFAALNDDSKVWSIEPLDDAYQILKQNVEKNPSFDINTEQIFFGSKSAFVESVVDVHGYANVVGERDSGSVMVSLDDYVETHNIVPDAIKIDVEGYEVDILKGSLATFGKYRPVLFLETHLEVLHPLPCIKTYGYTKEDICDIIGDIGYDVYNFGTKIGNGLTFLTWMNGRDCPADRLVCLPR